LLRAAATCKAGRAASGDSGWLTAYPLPPLLVRPNDGPRARPGLRRALEARLTDTRKRRGLRHELGPAVSVLVAGAACGHGTPLAIGQAAGREQEVLAAHGAAAAKRQAELGKKAKKRKTPAAEKFREEREDGWFRPHPLHPRGLDPPRTTRQACPSSPGSGSPAAAHDRVGLPLRRLPPPRFLGDTAVSVAAPDTLQKPRPPRIDENPRCVALLLALAAAVPEGPSALSA
jgi:hypothetical protein